MSLADDLGYSHRTGNPLRLAVRGFAGTRAGGWVFSRTLSRLDDVVGRVSKGRQSAPGLLAGLAVLDLTTTGRTSGLPRTSHLIATPYDGGLGLLGTNFGQARTPAWALNLEADPHAHVAYRGVERDVVAHLATPEQTAEIFAAAAAFYPGYLRYRERVAETRRIRAFVLRPA